MQRSHSGEAGAALSGSQSKGRIWTILGVCFGAAALALIAIFESAQWYADRVLIQRYCGDPKAATDLVHEILTDTAPAEHATVRYAVAAKLLYLSPREDSETTQAYRARLLRTIEGSCR